eukprot:782927_1
MLELYIFLAYLCIRSFALQTFEKSEDPSSTYNSHRLEQFAALRGSIEEMNTFICPQQILIPETENELIDIIKKAHDLRKTIAIKGGGHSYAGTSSCCSADCWQIQMSHFNKTEIVRDGETDEIVSVRVGSGQTLANQHRIMHKHNVAVLGGICPSVGTGGHYQSSSMGAFIRSLGLGMDYIHTIRLIDSTGTKQVISKNSNNQQEKDLFWAILGSAPGSYGVVLDYEFTPLLDSDYPFVYVYQQFLPYNKDVFSNIFSAMMNSIENTYLRDVSDIGSISIVINPYLVDPSNTDTHVSNVIVVRISWSGVEHGSIFNAIPNHPQNKTWYDELLTPFDVMDEFMIESYGVNGTNTLSNSAIQSGYVDTAYRWYPATSLFGSATLGNLYHGNSTKYELWKNNVVDKLDDVSASIDDVNIISAIYHIGMPSGRNIVVNGEEMDTTNAMKNSVSYPLRDVTLFVDNWVVFGNGQQEINQSVADEAKATAEELKHVFNGDSIKSLAYPDDNYHDLDLNRDWKQYYNGNYEMYMKLRQIKTRVDPHDMFHGPATIKPLPVKQKPDCECCQDDHETGQKLQKMHTKRRKHMRKGQKAYEEIAKKGRKHI